MEKKVVLFDMSNLVMRCLFTFKVSPLEKEFKEFKAIFMKSFLKTIADNSPDKVICCIDNTSWRKDLADTYKANRAAQREKSAVDFDAFFSVVNQLTAKMKACLPNIQFVDVPKCEADDLIAVITKYNPDWNIINISTDKDFYQLFKHSNYSQYDGVSHKFVQVLNPDYALQMKIILGDKSDNIPRLKNGVGNKTAASIIDNGTLDEWLDKNDLREKYEMNTKLISFECIPQEYVDRIKDAVSSWKGEKFNKGKFMNFVLNEGLVAVFEKSTDYIEALEKIHE